MIETYEIPVENMDLAQKRIDSLNKAAKKIGMPEITLTITKRFMKKISCGVFKSQDIPCFEVILSGSQPKYDGWEFLGLIRHLESGNILNSFPDKTISENYRTSDTHCDHCQKKRQRNETFIVRHEDGREFKVGRSCLRDFLGHRDPHFILKIAELMMWLSVKATDYDAGRERSDKLPLDILVYLECVVAHVDQSGFKSKSHVGTPTSLAALASMHANSGHEKEIHKIEITPSVQQKARDILDFMRGPIADLPAFGGNTYLINLHTIMKLEWITMKEIGLVSSSVAFYYKHLGQELYKKKAEKLETFHVGTPKQRMDGNLTVVDVHNYFDENRMADYYIIKFVDGQGHRFTWFTNESRGLVVGDSLEARFTVVRHAEYRGTKSTQINRVSWTEKTPAIQKP